MGVPQRGTAGPCGGNREAALHLAGVAGQVAVAAGREARRPAGVDGTVRTVADGAVETVRLGVRKVSAAPQRM